MEVRTFADIKEALKKRMAFFDEMGCRASDHALEYVMYAPASEEEIEAIVAKKLAGGEITKEEELKYKTAFMLFVGREYSRLGWVMQLHYGCERDNKLRCLTGWDRIPDTIVSITTRRRGRWQIS